METRPAERRRRGSCDYDVRLPKMQSAWLLLALLSLAAPALSADKVLIGYYSESLCPDCIYLSTGPMNDAFKEVPSIFTLHYVPWGNAVLGPNNTFDCQHGPMECTINTVEACVIYYYPNQTQFWPFIYCMDSSEKQDLKVAKKCASSLSMDWASIDSCTTGDLGHKLELQYANETASLRPQHEYTPWVTVNGKHDKQAEGSNLIKVICKNYEGKDKPTACSRL